MKMLASELYWARVESRHSQREVADFIIDWMANHDVRTEIDEVRARLHGADVERFDQVAAIITDHLDRHPEDVRRSSLSQASVSKWQKGRHGPSPDKWLAVAAYLEVPLWELHDMMTADLQPQSVRRLRRELADAQAEIGDLEAALRLRERDLEKRERDLDRAERVVAQLKRDIAELRDRMPASDRGERAVAVGC